MPVVDRTAVRASRNLDIRGYGSRIAFAALTCPGRRECCIRVCRFNWSNNNFKYDSAISRRGAPEVCKNCFASLRIEGAGNAGRSMRPQPRVQMKKAHEHSHHGHTGNHPAFPAQWFYGLLRALPGDQALLSPSPALVLADLTPTLGRQNDTTWPYASASFVRLAVARLTPPRPPHPAPRFVTCATPLCVGRDGLDMHLIWVGDEGKYF
jgi:hypothetical protein